MKERLPVGGHIVNGKLTGVKVWIPKGRHHLDGNKALWFARSRYGSKLGTTTGWRGSASSRTRCCTRSTR